MAWNTNGNQKPTDPPRSPIKKPFVVIAIPHTGSWNVEFTDRVYSFLKGVPSPHFDKTINLCRGAPVDVARNTLVTEILKDPNVTHIMWIDSDVVPEPPLDANEMIVRLLACDAPIASGVYRAMKKEGFCNSMWMKHDSGFVSIDEWTGNWIRADVIGFGCCLTKREVFEKIPPPWFVWDDMAGNPSEDFALCLKAAEYGIETRVFTDIKCSHISGKIKILSDGSVTVCEV